MFWAESLHQGLSHQWYWIVIAGAGIGLSLTPISTDAVNRATRGSYGEVTGITQTVRYFAASLGLAVESRGPPGSRDSISALRERAQR